MIHSVASYFPITLLSSSIYYVTSHFFILEEAVLRESGSFKRRPGGHVPRPRAYGSQKGAPHQSKKIEIVKKKGPADIFSPGPRSLKNRHCLEK